ncbi:hypothetical protein DDR33_15720 [Pararcticibacter amylolyticus]|uniref:T9SS C-terminal target domain-containing protein n=2 Tax=Pararcticibacter amylolyticus TaxID=2173175 RepID=A0A2U2PFE2_9SPHI|nr:hypothetical protein DDR33_15720 [Pararcticibacter amylolyticus]
MSNQNSVKPDEERRSVKTALKSKTKIKKLIAMKRINLLTIALIAVAVLGLSVTGCKKNPGIGQDQAGDFNKSSSAFTDSRTPPATQATIPNVISSNLTLTTANEWILDGPTFVTNGATLTINPGVFVRGRKTSTSGNPSFLIVTRGAKLIANGTQTTPIVFTSDQEPCNRAAGDWGGVVILGNGRTNVATTTSVEGIAASYLPSSPFLSFPASIQYGGSDEADASNASSLKYVRIEFAGDILQNDNELNGLTLGGVGSATTLSNIQVSYGADDGFEFFGGSVNAKYLISYGNNDDDFDFDQGYQGSIQFAVAVKLACASGYSSNPNGIECNNVTSPVTTVNSRVTRPILSNITILGHSASPGPIGSGSAGIGALFRAGTEFTFVNFLVGGFGVGVNYTAAATSPAPVYRDGAIHAFTTPSTPGAPASVDTQTGGLTNDFLGLTSPFSLSCSCTSPSIPNFTSQSPVAAGTLPAVTHAGGVFPAGTMDSAGSAFQGAMGTSRWDLGTYWTSYNLQGNTY